MKFPYSFRTIILAIALSIPVYFVATQYLSKPRVLGVHEVPIAFWAWRTRTPRTTEVQKAFDATNAKALFLRAGQFDVENGEVHRIRPVSGSLPPSVELHLVYNGTRKFLGELDRLEPNTVVQNIYDAYQNDLERAKNDIVTVEGLQLDFDAPTRLLPQYAKILRGLRGLLPPTTKLSITGLPTWAATEDIRPVLAAVDFWIPQCYGGTIPMNVGQHVPISSASDVEHTIKRVRQLNKPFYAGLSAYGYAILYSKEGELIEIRGDIDPVSASQIDGLELAEPRNFRGDPVASEIRYAYRAKSDVVLDGLIIRPGETLVFDMPTAGSLRASARAVRENAGDRLLGICLFRLPTSEDVMTLNFAEIAAAINDTELKTATAITLKSSSDGRLKLTAENVGAANTVVAEDAFTIDLSVPPGSISGASSLAGFTAFESLCARYEGETARPCSPSRANVIRLKTRYWKPNSVASIELSSKSTVPNSVPVLISTHGHDGHIERESREVRIQNIEN